MKIMLVLTTGAESPFMELVEVEDEHGKSMDIATVANIFDNAGYRRVELDVLPPLDKVTLTVQEPTGLPLHPITDEEWQTVQALRSGRAVVNLVSS